MKPKACKIVANKRRHHLGTTFGMVWHRHVSNNHPRLTTKLQQVPGDDASVLVNLSDSLCAGVVSEFEVGKPDVHNALEQFECMRGQHQGGVPHERQ